MKLLEGKCGLITGATSGIGREAAILFAKHGANVVISGRNEEAGQAIVAEMKALGSDAYFYPCDVREEEQVKALVDFTAKTYGRLDFAYNNAGITSPRSALSYEWTFEELDNMMRSNAYSIFFCMKYEIPYMQAQGGGNIVNTCSINSTCVAKRGLIYGTSKFAAYAMTMCAALDCIGDNIRVNGVGPGVTNTPMIQKAISLNPEKMNAMIASIPAGRMAEPIEQANAALYLLSDLSTHVTGQLILVDGGQSVQM